MSFPPPTPHPQLLPSAEELSSAVRGHHIATHPVAQLAGEFGDLYQPVQPHTLEGWCRRQELRLAVDLWTSAHLPPPRPDARLHTETLGAVIDRLARTQVRAYHLLMTVDDVAAPHVHAAWYRLAELVDEYAALADALAQRAVRLPVLGDGL